MSSPIFQAFSSSDFLGKLIFLSLGALSVISWIIILYKWWMTRKIFGEAIKLRLFLKKNKNALFNLDLRRFNQEGLNLNPLLIIFKNLKTDVLNLLKKNQHLSKSSDQDPVFLSQADMAQLYHQMQGQLFSEKKKMDKFLYVLSIIYSLSPLLGLLGTVWGIASTFSHLPQSGTALSNDAVLSGLSMALGTTVVGILVAIPSLIFYYYLKHSIKDCIDEIEAFLNEVLFHLEIQYRGLETQKI